MLAAYTTLKLSAFATGMWKTHSVARAIYWNRYRDSARTLMNII